VDVDHPSQIELFRGYSHLDLFSLLSSLFSLLSSSLLLFFPLSSSRFPLLRMNGTCYFYLRRVSS
jgi:hypothetical protein